MRVLKYSLLCLALQGTNVFAVDGLVQPAGVAPSTRAPTSTRASQTVPMQSSQRAQQQGYQASQYAVQQGYQASSTAQQQGYQVSAPASQAGSQVSSQATQQGGQVSTAAPPSEYVFKDGQLILSTPAASSTPAGQPGGALQAQAAIQSYQPLPYQPALQPATQTSVGLAAADRVLSPTAQVSTPVLGSERATRQTGQTSDLAKQDAVLFSGGRQVSPRNPVSIAADQAANAASYGAAVPMPRTVAEVPVATVPPAFQSAAFLPIVQEGALYAALSDTTFRVAKTGSSAEPVAANVLATDGLRASASFQSAMKNGDLAVGAPMLGVLTYGDKADPAAVVVHGDVLQLTTPNRKVINVPVAGVTYHRAPTPTLEWMQSNGSLEVFHIGKTLADLQATKAGPATTLHAATRSEKLGVAMDKLLFTNPTIQVATRAGYTLVWNETLHIPVLVYEEVRSASNLVVRAWQDDQTILGAWTSEAYAKAALQPLRLSVGLDKDAYLLSATLPGPKTAQNADWFKIVADTVKKYGELRVWTGILADDNFKTVAGRVVPENYYRMLEPKRGGAKQVWVLSTSALHVPGVPNATVAEVERRTGLRFK